MNEENSNGMDSISGGDSYNTRCNGEDTDLGASKPVAQPEPTLQQVKEWRARNWTQRSDVVVACGHKLNLSHTPSQANCPDCWEAYLECAFTPEQMSTIHSVLLNHGTKALVALEGKQFVKHFGEYLKRKLLLHASPEVQAASGIEVQGSPVMEVKSLEEIGA